MDEPKVRSLLAQLDTSVSEMHDILTTHKPELAYHWERVRREVRDLQQNPYPPQDVQSFASRAQNYWGVGMGSFGDIYINERFEIVRDELSSLLAQLEEAVRAGELHVGALRRHLTDLEGVLLEANQHAEAGRVRALLSATSLDCLATERLVAELANRKWPGSASIVPPILDAIKDELSPFVGEAARTARSYEP